MRTATILVIDGLGIGAMPDAGRTRAEDAAADTLGHIVDHRREQGRDLEIDALATSLGLSALRPDLELTPAPSSAAAACAALGYPGADSYAGHQTLVGADMSRVVLATVADHLGALEAVLVDHGHHVEALAEGRTLVVDGAALVHDNLEADPALAWNVSADTSVLAWEELLEIGTLVRGIAPVGRVIVVGGTADGPVTDFLREGPEGTYGFDTPASGFYANPGLQVRHLGADIDHTRQLPEIAARAGRTVTLIGKAADLLVTDSDVVRRPGVDTDLLLRYTREAAGTGLTVANVQETDLAGHSQDAERWARLLETASAAVGEMLPSLTPEDLLIVTGDHGNDPTLGHNFHTREYVPVMAMVGADAPALRGVRFASLADVGATAARWLGVDEGLLGNGVAAGEILGRGHV